MKLLEFNQILDGIVNLNRQIAGQEAGGASANDLRDQRDLLADNLSNFVNISVSENDTGLYQINSGGITLVNGVDRLHFEMSNPVSSDVYGVDYGVNDYTIKIVESNLAFFPQNGEFKAHFDSIDEDKKYIDDLANMSNYMLTTLNAQHKQGYDLNGSMGQNFFGVSDEVYSFGYDSVEMYNYMTVTSKDGAVTQMTGIKIINALEVNSIFDQTGGTAYVAAATSKNDDGTADMEWGSRTRDGSNAVYVSELFNIEPATIIETGRANRLSLELYTLKDKYGNEVLDSAGNPTYINALGTLSINSYYVSSMSQLGVNSNYNDTKIDEQDATLTQISDWRSSTSGVDWNEELTNMIKFQKGYSSCARCLTAMDECLDRLVNNTGVVGR